MAGKRAPNQKSIRFVVSEKNGNGHYFSQYNNADLIKAQNTLSDSAFRLYIYIGMYKGLSIKKERLNLSRQDAMACTGMSSRAFTNAVHELQEQGYLVPDPLFEAKNNYTYIESGSIT